MAEPAAPPDKRHSRRITGGPSKKGKTDKAHKRSKSAVLVDFTKLEMASLLRYKRYHKLHVRANCPKSELLAVTRKHFIGASRLKDSDVISQFLYANKRALEFADDQE